MSNLDIVRAWKDEDYRNSLNAAQLALLPTNPAGLVELTDTELEKVTGGKTKGDFCGLLSFGCTQRGPKPVDSPAPAPAPAN